MAGMRSIGINFTGKSTELDQAADKASRGLSSVSDQAENLDDKGSKATDSLGALSSGFELVGLDQYAAGLQGAAMATDFLSGVGTGLNLLMDLQAVKFIQAKVASIGHSIATKAAAAATAVMTGAQWLLNAAMSANPIGLVVLAIVALIAIVIIAWQRSATFRAIVTGAFNAVKAAAEAVGNWFRNTLWPWLSGVFSAVSGAAGKAKDGIVTAFTNAVTWLKGLPGKISSAVGGLFSKVSSLATAAKDWVTGKLGDGKGGLVSWIKGLPGKISSAASGMFDGLKTAFKSAINWLIGKWNDLSFGIPSIDTHIPGVGKVGGFTLNTPNIPMLAAGGRAIGSGLALIGERGPELLDLNAGASVVPLDRAAGGDTIVYVTIDGEQLQARIDKTVRHNNRELKRTVKAGG